jgi:hypothetical protein
MDDPNFYLGLATEITGKVRRLASFTGHAPSIGLHHEEIVREAVCPLMSRRFSLRTGFAFLPDHAVSSQGDILVVDESDPAPYFFQMGGVVVVHPRALACVVEVKTELSKQTFLQAVCNHYSFKQVAVTASPGRNLPTLIFAFDSADLAPDTLHQWYTVVDVPNNIASYPQMIYSLKRGALLLRPDRDSAPFGHYAVLGEESDELKSKDSRSSYRRFGRSWRRRPESNRTRLSTATSVDFGGRSSAFNSAGGSSLLLQRRSREPSNDALQQTGCSRCSHSGP